VRIKEIEGYVTYSTEKEMEEKMDTMRSDEEDSM
jgi:hypothetical protein